MGRFAFAKIKITTVILAFLRNHNWSLKSVKHLNFTISQPGCGYDAVYSLN